MKWEVEKTRLAVHKFNSGETAAKIGAFFGVSKNSVIGILNRQRNNGTVVRCKVKKHPCPHCGRAMTSPKVNQQ